jgi:hypothetical protein
MRARRGPRAGSCKLPHRCNRRKADELSEDVRLSAAAAAAAPAAPLPTAAAVAAAEALRAAVGSRRALQVGGARVTPGLAQQFLAVFCARLPGVDRRARARARDRLPDAMRGERGSLPGQRCEAAPRRLSAGARLSAGRARRRLQAPQAP